MAPVMSACGVLCSECAAYDGRARGTEYQAEGAAAWLRIYALKQEPASMACGGCLSSDEDVFHSSRTCRARRCCKAKGLTSCAECDVEPCEALERAQSNWDAVPALEGKLSRADFVKYAQPYCGHRVRLAAARRARADRPRE